jgi:tetratricopeptide (TPR) repeat protein
MKLCATFFLSAIGLAISVGSAVAEGPLDDFFQATTGQPFTPPGYQAPSGAAPQTVNPSRKRAAPPSKTRTTTPRPQPAPTEKPKAAEPPQRSVAGQQDWSDCAGKEPARVISACSRIVPNTEESAQDRADAYLFRAGAYLAQGNLDQAIADYDAAIILTPKNVVAYSSRALAYLRKGDRDHAVLDYNTAARLDPKSVAQISAANPDFEEIGRIARAFQVEHR